MEGPHGRPTVASFTPQGRRIGALTLSSRPTTLRLLLLPVVTLLLAPATPAAAQYGRPISASEKEGLWRAGPFRLTPRLQLRNAGVDTNPLLSPGTGVEETEVVLRGGLITYVPAGRRFRLRGDGWLDYTFFSNALEPRAVHPGGDVRAELDVSRFTFFGGGGHLEARERYTTDIDARIERTEGWLNAGVQYQVTRIVGLDFGAEERRHRYLPDTPEGEQVKLLLDRDSRSYGGRFRYALTPLTTALVTAEVIEDAFRFGDPARAITRSYRYLAGFELGEKAVVTGRLLLGFRDIPASSAGSVAPYRGLATRGLLLVPLLERRVRLTAALHRDTYYSAGAALAEGVPTRNTYAYGQWRFTVEFDLPLRFVGSALAAWENADYQLPVVVGGMGILRQDRVRFLGGSLLRRVGRNARLGLTALYTTRTSTIPGLDYRRWQYGLQGDFAP